MDYRDKVFIKVAENLSFSKASKELFISQPDTHTFVLKI